MASFFALFLAIVLAPSLSFSLPTKPPEHESSAWFEGSLIGHTHVAGVEHEEGKIQTARRKFSGGGCGGESFERKEERRETIRDRALE